MQQELIEMLEEIIPYVEVWHKDDQDVLDKAEALVAKAKNNAPAVELVIRKFKLVNLCLVCILREIEDRIFISV